MKKIHDLELLYIPGEYSYRQRVRGSKNYEHMSGNQNFNGCGGVQTFTGSKLIIYGIDEEGKEIGIPIKNEILQAFGREKLSESFTSNLESKLPNELMIEADVSGNLKITEESCQNIYMAMHSHKKRNRIG